MSYKITTEDKGFLTTHGILNLLVKFLSKSN